jgi:GT2 family glycosyltransferase
LVDNGSTELASLQLLGSGVEFIHSDRNVGFSKGMNLGIAWAISRGMDFVLCLNNDVTIDKDAISEMVRVFQEDQSVGGACPLVLQSDETGATISLGKRIILTYGLTYSGFMRSSRRQIPTHPIPIEGLDGCCMMFRTATLEKTGAFNPSFHGTEDVEISLRVRKKGFSLYAVPQSIVWHLGAASKGGRMNPADAFFMGRNWPTLNKLYGTILERLAFWPAFMILQFGLWTSIWTLTRRPSNLRWFISGIVSALRKESDSDTWMNLVGSSKGERTDD